MNEYPNFLPHILERESCRKHRALLGAPCFDIRTATGKSNPAICNSRALKAGFNGKISLTSLSKGGKPSA